MSEPVEQPDFHGVEVVLDMISPYVFIGRLTGESLHSYILEDVDCHDLRDSSTTRELYVLDTRRHGIGANRKLVHVRKEQVVSISRLADVLT